jgi:hypothetical protein
MKGSWLCAESKHRGAEPRFRSARGVGVAGDRSNKTLLVLAGVPANSPVFIPCTNPPVYALEATRYKTSAAGVSVRSQQQWSMSYCEQSETSLQRHACWLIKHGLVIAVNLR